MKKMAIFAICSLLILSAALSLTGCFSPWKGGEATLTIYLGGGNNRSAMPWPPEEADIQRLDYVVTLSKNGDTVTIKAKGGKTVSATVAVGLWNVKIDAYYEGRHYATRSTTVDVKGGQDNKVALTMDQIVWHTVTFQPNNGESQFTQIVKDGDTADRPGNPTRTGHGFADWYSNINLNTVYNFDTPVTGNITLYAKWDANLFTVTFDSNGGSTIQDQSIGYGSNVVKPPDPTRTGYAFDKWYTDSACTIPAVFPITVTGAVNLFAKWIADQFFSLSFEQIADGAPVLTGITIYRSSDPEKAEATITSGTGYTSVKWYYNNILLGEEASLLLNSSDIRYNMIGPKFLTVEVWKDGKPYNTTVIFTVAE